MKRLTVKICGCAQCVMNGSMDIIESIESLKKLKSQLRFNAIVEIVSDECLCQKDKGNQSVVVIINDERIENATSEIVAAKIISLISKK